MPLQPDQGGHAAGLSIPAVGEKKALLFMHADVTAVDRAYSLAPQLPSYQARQVCEPMILRRGPEALRGVGIRPQACRAHVRADLIVIRPYAGTDPGKHLVRGCAHGSQRRADDARGNAAPPGVDGRDLAAGGIRQQQGNAIRHHDRAYPAGAGGMTAVSDLARACGCRDHAAAMYLVQPAGFRGQTKPLPQCCAVGAYHRRVISHMGRQIEPLERVLAVAAPPGRNTRAHEWRRRPAGRQPPGREFLDCWHGLAVSPSVGGLGHITAQLIQQLLHVSGQRHGPVHLLPGYRVHQAQIAGVQSLTSERHDRRPQGWRHSPGD